MPKKKVSLKVLLYLSLISFFVTTILSGCKELFPNTPNSKSNGLVWQSTENGLEYYEMSAKNKDFIVIKLDPKILQLNIQENPAPPDNLSIFQIHKKQDSLLTFNGIFFTEKYNPTGLIISEKKTIHPLSSANLLNGILTINKNHEAEIFSYDDFKKQTTKEKDTIEFAIQNGPLLIYQNEIQTKTDTRKKASRTAIGIDTQGKIIVIILKQSLINFDNTLSLYEFAHLLVENTTLNALNLKSLLNLDGGPSTGLAIGERYFPEIEKVQNVVITKKRNS